MERVLGLEEIKDAVSDLGARYGIGAAWLFGSYARGDATPASDVDLRIEQGGLRGFFALSALRLDLCERLGTDVDLLTSDSLDEHFLNCILREEIPLYVLSR